MPSQNGEFLFNADASAAPLTDEQQVFVECVEDVLASTPGLEYALITDRSEIVARYNPMAYAIFLIQTNPLQNIALAVQLTDRSFTVRLNGLSFTRRRGRATTMEAWIDRRCRDLERMVKGELRLVQQTLLTLPLASTLEIGSDGRWHKFGQVANGWLAMLTFFLPYAFLLNGSKQRLYCEWFRCGE